VLLEIKSDLLVRQPAHQRPREEPGDGDDEGERHQHPGGDDRSGIVA
jgi:hypothetical protein